MSKKYIDHTIAEEAIELVTGNRQAQYGHPSRNFKDTADLWSVILGVTVTPEQVALCMVQVKVAREIHNPKRDNLVDAVGYLLAYDACIEPVQEKLIHDSLCRCNFCVYVNYAGE